MPRTGKRTSESTDLRQTLRREVLRADRALRGPRTLLSRAAARKLDAACTADFAIPSILLMEHASLGIADVLRRVWDRCPCGILILAGPGNNGGDGLAAARHLACTGVSPITIVLIADPAKLSGDAAANFTMAQRMGINIRRGHSRPRPTIQRAAAALSKPAGTPLLIVDALLGTGLSRPPAGAILEAIETCNQLWATHPAAAVLSVDVPSGIDADTGSPLNAFDAVLDDATLTMAGHKPGLLRSARSSIRARVGIIPIGAPPQLLRRLGNRLPAG